MSDDEEYIGRLPTSLREAADCAEPWDVPGLLRDAADRIEWLEASNAEIAGDKLREVAGCHATNSHLRRQLGCMTRVAEDLVIQRDDMEFHRRDRDEANSVVLDLFIDAIRECGDGGTGPGPLAPIILAEVDRLRAEVTRLTRALADAEDGIAELEARLFDANETRKGG